MLTFFALFSCLVAGIHAECPNINELPVLNIEGDTFYCGFNWGDDYPWDQEIPLEGCNTDQYKQYMDGYDYTTNGEDLFVRLGALIVKAGCTYYGYSKPDYKGDRTEYHGPATFPDGCTGSNCPPVYNDVHHGFPSSKCRCQQDPIICQPSDHYVTIMQCDNTESDVETICSYTKTVGTSYTQEAQDSMSIDTHIEASMTESFFKFFETQIGFSVDTGYDWTHTSSEAKSETKSYNVQVTADPHTMLIIQGAEGECGDNNVKTELFKIITTDGNGNVISEKLDWFNPEIDEYEEVNKEHISQSVDRMVLRGAN